MRSPAYRSMSESIALLYLLWASLEWTTPSKWSSKHETLSLICNRARTRCRRVLEHLFRGHSLEVFEAIVDCWDRLQLVVSSPPVVVIHSYSVGSFNAGICGFRTRGYSDYKLPKRCTHAVRKHHIAHVGLV